MVLSARIRGGASRFATTVWLLLGLGALVPACGGGGGGDPTGIGPPALGRPGPALKAFDDCEALNAHLTDLSVERFVDLWRGGAVAVGGLPPMGGMEGDGRGGEPAAPPMPPGSPSEYSGTNLQEAGVDEPDLVKTDGETVHYVTDRGLHVIDAWPPEEARILARVEIEGWGGSIFLLPSGHVVALTTLAEGGWWGDPTPPPGPGGGPRVLLEDGPPAPPGSPPPFYGTRVTVVDVADPTSPTVVRTIDLEGSLVGARLVDGIVYLVTQAEGAFYDPDLQAALDALDLPDPWSLSDAQREGAADEVRARVRPVFADYVARVGRDRLLPDVRIDGGERTELLACSEVFEPGRPSDLALLSVVGLDPLSGEPPKGVGILANGWQVYGSPTALYVAQASRWWWWADGQAREAATDLHAFTLNAGDPTYVASGRVPGWALSSFSMSEYGGYLRIATTDQTFGGWFWGGGVSEGRSLEAEPAPDANNVFVLRPNEGDLEIVGSLRGIAPDEQIRAVRFLGDRGYVVTFRQVDPLFALDLSDPAAPAVTGELVVTGFSTYLHPLGEDHLIGVGREATETGFILGLQLQLFDVSDPSAPSRVHQEALSTGTMGWSYSEAEHDHHAFTFYEGRNLLAIPVTLEDGSHPDGDYRFFSGIVVYEVSVRDGFQERGRVSHTGFVEDLWCSPDQRKDPATDESCGAWAYPWWATMRRSVFIEDVLYAFSDVGVTASRLSDVGNPVATIPLGP